MTRKVNSQREVDGAVELLEDVSYSSIYNEDLAPTKLVQRTWGTYNYAALWIGMCHCIPTYMLAGGLIALGMDWKQALLTITLGNLIVLLPMLLNGHPGAKYGIPFPVFARASFGAYGANIPAMARAVVACGWFGINTFVGGNAISLFISAIFPGFAKIGGHATIAGLGIPAAIGFMIFWCFEMWIVFKGMDTLRAFENWAAPAVMVLGFVLVIYMIIAAKGFGPMMAEPSKFKTFGSFFKVFIPSLTGMVGFWATLSLNIPDFTRFARSQREQAIGQAIGLPPTMLIFSAMGVIVTSASAILYGKMIWDPGEVISHFTNPIVLLVGFFGIVVASLSVNVAANLVSPSNDFSNLWPKKISFRLGGLITGIIGIAIMPWKLLADPSGYIFNWLGTYSGLLGPIAGIIIADYWLVKNKTLNLKDLYLVEGEYKYTGGYNMKAIIALAAGIFVALIGKVVPPLHILFDYAWFVGFGVSFLLYWAIMPKSTAKKN